MKVIITGATGFIGRNLAESLHADGLDILASGRNTNIGSDLTSTGITFHPADITNLNELRHAFAPADVVVHCAGRIGDWGRAQDFVSANMLGTRNIIEACRLHNITRLVFVSTPSIYYSGKDRLNVTESEPLPQKPHTHYARTKLQAERDLFAAVDSGLKTIVLRPRAVYGPYDESITPRILKLADRKRFPLLGGGQALTDITYISNLTNAVRCCFSAPLQAWNEVYNISNGEPISMREWFGTVAKVFGKQFNPKTVPITLAKLAAGLMEIPCCFPFGPKHPNLTRFSVGYMSRTLTMSIDKAKQLLGYTPKTTNREGFELYANWYKAASKDDT